MGHELEPLGQHDDLVFTAVLVYANTATPTPSDKTVNTVNKIFFFILFSSKIQSFLSGCRTKRVRRELGALGRALNPENTIFDEDPIGDWHPLVNRVVFRRDFNKDKGIIPDGELLGGGSDLLLGRFDPA